MATKKAFINRDFNDAGTGASFTASTEGKPETMPDIEAGAFVNYEAAGLVRKPTADEPKAKDTKTA